MNLKIGSNDFKNVHIPLLWGSRAIVLDKQSRVSIINLESEPAVLEVLGGNPAPGISYRLENDGFQILDDHGKCLYYFYAKPCTIVGEHIKLPTCQIDLDMIKVGRSLFSNNVVHGFGVGILVSESGLVLGASLPPGLAKLAA
ncbi:MAG: hypothetical protein H3C47_05110 [Candidatus Cloacimonetes bacterium]|nr:hypothetical protein [Candidatus Cloacimonadota bacterium]